VSRGRYVSVAFPRSATLDAAAPQPAWFLAELMGAALNHGMPARRRGGPVLAWMGRRRSPAGVVASTLRALPRREAPAIDAVLEEVRDGWPGLAARALALGAPPATLSGLRVTRSAAETFFVFGEGRFPLLVLKKPHSDEEGVLNEVRALERAEASGAAPRYLGRLGPFHVQEGLAGLPLSVAPVWPHALRDLPRPAAFDQLDRALERLATTTARRGARSADLLPALDAASDYGLPPRVKDAVRRAHDQLEGLDIAVLQHRDMSAQNWLVDGDRLAGLVDWELARSTGVPGHDAVQAAVSLFEHGVALTKWSGDAVVTRFRAAWRCSPFFQGARQSLRSSARAAGVPDELTPALEIGYFARRLGRALAKEERQSLEPAHLAAMLTTVCLS
jgi:hypothetical protein